MSKHALTTVAAVVALCAPLTMTACHSGNGSSSAARAATIPSAQVAVAHRGDITQVLTLAGQFQPYQVVDVHPKVSGYMVRINVDIGDIVHAGQVLAVLEVPELNAQLQQTIFQVQQSQQEIARAQNEISRTEALDVALHKEAVRLQKAAATRPGLIAQQEIDDAVAKDLSAQAQIDAAKAAMAAAQEHANSARADNQRVQALEDYTKVTAPIDGVVIWRYADTGALIQGGTNSDSQALPIVRLSQSGLLRLRVPVPEDDVDFVHLGDILKVRVDAVNRSFDGKVVRFTRNLNFETRTMETEVDVENKDLALDPGMYAYTMLQLGQATNVVTIPVNALELNAKNQKTVYVLDSNNRIHIRPVTVGIEGSQLAEVKSGLQPGERVILGGQDNYQDNEEVNPILASSPASETVQKSGGEIDMDADSNGGNQ
ncbi:MAG: efflux RND transporter periplasmic adaptor subunit [Acidobacteriota bacterium]